MNEEVVTIVRWPFIVNDLKGNLAFASAINIKKKENGLCSNC